VAVPIGPWQLKGCATNSPVKACLNLIATPPNCDTGVVAQPPDLLPCLQDALDSRGHAMASSMAWDLLTKVFSGNAAVFEASDPCPWLTSSSMAGIKG
jgi:hypothetical protein